MKTLGWLVLALGWAAITTAQEAPEILPRSTIVCVELSDSSALLGTFFDSPVRRQVEELELYRHYLQSDGYKKLKLIVTLFELKTGLEWRPSIQTLTAGGVWFAADAASGGGVTVIAKSSDEQVLAKLLGAVVEAARDEAIKKGQAAPEPTVYRDVKFYPVEKGNLSRVGSWLIFANKQELAKGMVDRLLDGPTGSLTENERFQSARQTYAGQGGWGWADLHALRESGAATKLLSGRADNALGEILLGGVLAVLKEAPYATATVTLPEAARVALTLSAPAPKEVGPRQFFFGPEGRGAAETPFSVPGTLLSLTAFRDLGAMWLAADDLFSEAVAAKFSQQDSKLGVFFNGKNFGSDVLGQLEPQLQLLVVEQTYSEGTTPAVKLPAAALVARVKGGGSLQRQLRAAFQTILGFVNVGGTQAGRPMMEMKSEERDGATLVSGNYVEDEPGKTGIHYNFSPTLLQRDRWFVLCSTKGLAEQLSQRLGSAPATTGVNSQVRVQADAVGRVLSANRSNFVAQQQLKKGLDEAEAARQVDALLSLTRLLHDAGITLRNDAKEVALELQLDTSKALRAP